MHTLNLTTRQVQLILAALDHVTPTGGGSEQHSLSLKVAHDTGVDRDHDLLADLGHVVLDEIRAAFDDQPNLLVRHLGMFPDAELVR